MVDFKSRLGAKGSARIIDPLALYDTLDRASDKGPLRPSQVEVLEKWHKSFRESHDVIVKLHTGQGKTLIGLLMLQSLLNEGRGPALYLCPNKYLVLQTELQARQFGIKVITSEQQEELPVDFVNGKSIYIATAHKLFNGLTRFRLGAHSLQVGCIVLDDCHAITDIMRSQVCIRIPKDHECYLALLSLFTPSLEHQGAGSLEEIKKGSVDVTMRVPYWDIIDKKQSLLDILSTHAVNDSIRFAWPLLRDIVEQCDIFFSGSELEIVPVALPIDEFGSFDRASRRIYMSATVTDDSFLVRSLGIDPGAVQRPVSFSREKWSGEKLILMPELTHHELDRGLLLSRFGHSDDKRRYGVVVLTPSFKSAADWKANGASVGETNNIFEIIDNLRTGNHGSTLVLANRYDGIDLPDDACRILILDGLPLSITPSEKHFESVHYTSASAKSRIFRRIEQGLGRSVRGEKDYSIILLTGQNLVQELRFILNQEHLSPQTRAQVQIGIAVSGMAEEDIAKKGMDPFDSLWGVISLVLTRDDNWKTYYKEQMDSASITTVQAASSDRFMAERSVDEFVRRRSYSEAADALQALIDSRNLPEGAEKALFLERLAHLTYFFDKDKSAKMQRAAHRMNRYVLMPQSPVDLTSCRDQTDRIQKVLRLIRSYPDAASLAAYVDNILRRLAFGSIADSFEEAMRDLGELWGFESMRPEKEWRSGPDNLWILPSGEVIVIESKSEVDVQRAEIYKKEMAQLLMSIEWTRQQFGKAIILPIMVIPTKFAAKDATPSPECRVIREKGLRELQRRSKSLYEQIGSHFTSGNISEASIKKAIAAADLDWITLRDRVAEVVVQR